VNNSVTNFSRLGTFNYSGHLKGRALKWQQAILQKGPFYHCNLQILVK